MWQLSQGTVLTAIWRDKLPRRFLFIGAIIKRSTYTLCWLACPHTAYLHYVTVARQVLFVFNEY